MKHHQRNRRTKLAMAAALLGAMSFSALAATTVDGFSDGRQGWRGSHGGSGGTWIDTSLGNDAPALHTVFNDFGITFSNRLNPAFVGDLTASPSLTIGLDTLTESIKLTGKNVTRELIVDLRDHSHPENGLPYTSVWYDLGTLSSADTAWQHFQVTIGDTSATALPSGWGGYGAEDPQTGAPELPADRSFASVLAHVDQIAFTTLEPGYFYAAASFNVAVDNISISTPVPEAGTASMIGLGLIMLAGMVRRRQRIDSGA